MTRPQGRVKPLEWIDKGERSSSVTGFGQFGTTRQIDGSWVWCLYVDNGRICEVIGYGFKTLEEAKAAAQEHYYKIMAEALEPVFFKGPDDETS